MGRNRKATINSIVEMPGRGYYTIVAYRDTVKSNRYGGIQCEKNGRRPRGALVWLDSADFIPLGTHAYRAGRIYRKNQREPERGCECQCCEHVNGLEPEPGE